MAKLLESSSVLDTTSVWDIFWNGLVAIFSSCMLQYISAVLSVNQQWNDPHEAKIQSSVDILHLKQKSLTLSVWCSISNLRVPTFLELLRTPVLLHTVGLNKHSD